MDVMDASRPMALSMKIVVRDGEGRCLVLQRSRHSKGNPGKWDFPGGKVDPGESPDAALVREVREETGLDVVVTGVVGAAQSEAPGRIVAYLILEGHAMRGAVRLSSEHEAFAWIAPADLVDCDLAPQFTAFAKSYATLRK